MPVYQVHSGDFSIIIKGRRTLKTAAKAAVQEALDEDAVLSLFVSVAKIGEEDDPHFLLTIPLLNELGADYKMIGKGKELNVHRNKKSDQVDGPEMAESVRRGVPNQSRNNGTLAIRISQGDT
jgi:hypothetical protein